MERRDNYAIAAAQARQLFLGYDPQRLAEKLNARLDEEYLYTAMFAESYRIHLKTGSISRFHGGAWVEANSFNESLTLLDLVCDSRDDRFPTGQWKNMQDFGHTFHQNLLEMKVDPLAEKYQANPEQFAKACEAMGGQRFPQGDAAYSLPVFEDMRMVIQLWFGDDEFPAQLRYLWDANADRYLRYETMYYALGLLQSRLQENM